MTFRTSKHEIETIRTNMSFGGETVSVKGKRVIMWDRVCSEGWDD